MNNNDLTRVAMFEYLCKTCISKFDVLCTNIYLFHCMTISVCTFSRINGNDSCTEILIETLGDSIVNCTDTKGR